MSFLDDMKMPARAAEFQAGMDAARITTPDSVARRSLLPGTKPQVLTTTYAGAPTITDQQTTTSTISGSRLVGFEDAAFTHLGATLAPSNDPRFLQVLNSAANLYIGTFCTDAPVFEMYLNQSTGKYFLEVLDTGLGDWQPAMAAGAGYAGSAGTPTLVKVDFGSARRARTFRISGKGVLFGGIRVGANDTVWPHIDRRKLCVHQGDSYQDTGAGGRAQSFAATCSRLMGWQYWSEGDGGSGYTKSGNSQPGAPTFAQRISTYVNTLQRRIAGVNTLVTPDHYIWEFGYNDAGASAAAIQAGFDAGYAAANFKPTVIVGPWTPAGSTTALLAVRDAVKAKADAYGLPFIEITNWVNTTNQAVMQNVAGGDAVHPLQIGHDYLGFRLAQALSAAGIA